MPSWTNDRKLRTIESMRMTDTRTIPAVDVLTDVLRVVVETMRSIGIDPDRAATVDGVDTLVARWVGAEISREACVRECRTLVAADGRRRRRRSARSGV